MADRDGWKAGGFFYWALGNIFRSSRSLLRQVFLLGSGRHFFSFFFASFSNMVLDRIFLGFGRGFGGQNGCQNQFLECFWRCFFEGHLEVDFLVFF